MTQNIVSALKSARVAKEAVPDAKVVIGGSHVTFMDRETLAEEPATDIVVRGEGEETLLELVKQLPDLPKLDEVKGITFRKSDQIIRTPSRPFIQNLDALPRPAYKYIPINRYRILGKKSRTKPKRTQRDESTCCMRQR
jgi:anaerobic magnesium-protoporphyrin IX monomethyl ester cyclase